MKKDFKEKFIKGKKQRYTHLVRVKQMCNNLHLAIETNDPYLALAIITEQIRILDIEIKCIEKEIKEESE